MRILICRANAICPEPRVEKTARALHNGGHEVQILGWDRQGKLPGWEEIDGINIHRLVVRSKNLSGLMNIFPMLVWTLRLFVFLLRQRQTYDVIHACDLDTVLPALWCKRLLNKHVVYDIFDFYADMLRKTPGWLVRWVRKIELSAIGRADAVILADDCRRRQIAGSHPKRVEVIYNAPEDIGRQPLPAGKQGFRIIYIGNLQIERGLLYLLAVMARRGEWHLDLGGSLPRHANYPMSPGMDCFLMIRC
jgi:glycosyltransferase involved in cell wall biosynthesis